MKILFYKMVIVGIFLLFFTNICLGTTYKMGMVEPIHFGYFKGMTIYNNYAITVSLYGDICVYSIANDKFEFAFHQDFNFQIAGLYIKPVVYGHYLYIPKREALLIFDLSNLPEISYIKSYPLDGAFSYIYSINIYDNILALGGVVNSSALLLSLEDPENPSEISRVEGSFNAVQAIYITDKYLVTSSTLNGVEIWNINDPYNPILITSMPIDNLNYTFLADNNNLILNYKNGNLSLINLSDPQNIPAPVEIRSGQTYLQGAENLENNIVFINGSELLFCEKSELANPSTINWESTALTLTPYLYYFKNLGGGQYKLFALDDKDKKAIFTINETDRTSAIIGSLDYSDFKNESDIETKNNYLYTTCWGKGIAIYRINEEGLPELIKIDSINYKIFFPFGLKKITQTTNKGSTDYLLIYDSGKCVITDITDPENPLYVSTLSAPMKIVYYNSPYLFCFDGYSTFSVFDLSDIASPQKLVSDNIPESQQTSLYYYNNYLYIGKFIIDISDKTNPVVVNDTVPAKKLTGINNYLICWPTSPSKILKVLKLNDPVNPEEVQEIEISGGSNIYSLNLFTKQMPQNEMVVCSYYAVNSSLPQTFIFTRNSNTDKFETQYILDASVNGIAFGSDYLFVSQEGKAPLAAFGISFSIPHIATTWGWETNIIVDNLGEDNTYFRYSINDGIKIEDKKELIEAKKQIAFPLTKGQSGEICMPFTGYLGFKVSYHHTEEHGIAEFPLSYGYFKNLTLYTPQYLAERLTWMGFATSNCENDTVNLTLSAYDKNGNKLESENFNQKPMAREASVLSNIFTETNWKNIAKIDIESNGFVSGITISGNGNSQLLFTPAVYNGYKGDIRYLPHIDINGYWNTYLIMDNPTDQDITVNLKLYSEGNEVVNEQKTIPANSNLTVLLNDYADQNIDCGEVLNCGSDLVVRLSYMFQTTGATAEFLINGYEKSYELFFNLPAYRADVLTWWGIAIMNPNDSSVQVTLDAYSNGQVIDTANITLNPHTKMADLIENIFPNLNGQTVERVYAKSTGGSILGLNICGSNQDRYLFTKAYHY